MGLNTWKLKVTADTYQFKKFHPSSSALKKSALDFSVMQQNKMLLDNILPSLYSPSLPLRLSSLPLIVYFPFFPISFSFLKETLSLAFSLACKGLDAKLLLSTARWWW